MNSLPISIPGILISKCGLSFPQVVPMAQWLEIGRLLNDVGSFHQFLLGDWLNFGAKQYGEKFRQACIDTGIDYGTLANYCYTCNKIEFSRRREKLPYSHHYEVAHLAERDQDKWLDHAEENKWSVSELRRNIRVDGAEYHDEPTGEPVRGALSYAVHLIRFTNDALPHIKEWTGEQRAQWKENLKPLVQFYEAL